MNRFEKATLAKDLPDPFHYTTALFLLYLAPFESLILLIVLGEVLCKNIYKIPLSNLVGRSIERPLKSPLVPKVITTPTSIGVASIPAVPSLSLPRMEIKEIASRTRKELLGKAA